MYICKIVTLIRQDSLRGTTLGHTHSREIRELKIIERNSLLNYKLVTNMYTAEDFRQIKRQALLKTSVVNHNRCQGEIP